MLADTHTADERPSPRRATGPRLLWLVLCALLIPTYFWLRYRGLWIEQDTSVFCRVAGHLVQEGTFLSSQFSYPHGYHYQSLVAMLSQLTGIPILTLLTAILPFQLALFSVLAFTMYRSFVGEARTAFLATALLLVQPDFLFSQLRGNHEKVTQALIVLALFLLARSVGSLAAPRRLATFTILFYLAVYALISTNAFFAFSFVGAIALSLLLGTKVWHRLRVTTADSAVRGPKRLIYTATSCLVLAFAFMFYVYTPSGFVLSSLNTVLEKAVALSIGAEPAFDPYQYVGYAWVDPGVYPALMALSVVVALVSAAEWLCRAWRLAVRREHLRSPGEHLVWLLYAAFGVQFAGSVVLDQLGIYGGNLQVRVFPTFMLLAIALAAPRLLAVLDTLRAGRLRLPATAVATLVGVWFVAASLLKATSEPLLSNTWLFYSPAELKAIAWTDGYMRDATIWIGPQDRLREVHNSRFALTSTSGNAYPSRSAGLSTPAVLSSPLVRAAARRFGIPMLEVESRDRIYDNGDAQIFRRRPSTPFQR